MDYNYISAGAGAGKTEWAIKKAAQLNKFRVNVLIIVPTIDLCESYVQRSNGKITAIHTRNTPNGSIPLIQKTVADAAKSRHAMSLVICEAAFNRIPYFPIPQSWIVIKDEAVEPLSINTIKCTDSALLLLDWFKLENVGDGLGINNLFQAISITKSKPKTTTVEDSILGVVHDLATAIEDDNIEVLVDIERMGWEQPELRYSLFVKPELYSEFNACYFMSANFEHTFLYQQWKKMGVNWKNKTPHTMASHPPSERVSIHYWSEYGSWSAARRSRKDAGKTNLEHYLNWFINIERGDDYVYSANNDVPLNLSGVRMPAVCHGLNNWRHYTKFMSAASYLINKGDEHIYRYYGSSTTDARALRSTQMLYQQLMRTDLRNYSSDKEIKIYVPTLTEARELLVYLPRSTIHNIGKKHDGDVTDITATLKASYTPKTNTEEEVLIETDEYSIAPNTKTYHTDNI